jgi:hypothetical protein
MYSHRGWSYGSTRRSFRPRWPTTPTVRGEVLEPERASLSVVALAPLPVALVVVALVAWYHFVFAGFGFGGSVVDAATGRGVAGARVWSGSAVSLTNPDGTFHLAAVKPPELISIDAPGYGPAVVRATVPTVPVEAALQPKTAELRIVDAESGAPISGATADTAIPTRPLGDGRVQLAPAQPGAMVTARADGYVAREVAFDGSDPFQVELAPRYVGQVSDARSGKAIAQAHVAVGTTSTISDGGGAFTFLGPLRTTRRLVVLAPGYKRAQLDLGQARSVDVRLEPNEVKAIYLTHDAARLPEYRNRLFDLLSTTELNAVVIDVKSDRGYLTYHSGVPLAQQIGANDRTTADDIDQLLADLHARGVYAIARIVVFKDDLLARNGPRAGLDVAIKDRRTGRPWVDGEGLAWVDAFQPPAWDYNTALAREAIGRGFDEVQFDYIRFPTDPSPGGTVADTQYAQPYTEANRVAALKTFLGQAHAAVQDAGGFLGVDTFGLSAWWDHSDGGIGQDLAEWADLVDYVCPMVYPSTFGSGLPGGMPYPDVVEHPYDVVYQSIRHLLGNQLAGTHAVVRPWLQYFDDYGDRLDGFRYDEQQIQDQERGAAEAGALGWMLWDPSNQYQRGGIAAR